MELKYIRRGVEYKILIDDDDYVKINEFISKGWRISYSGILSKTYACMRRGRECVYIHRIVINPPDGMDVDHINRDRLDNRKCNLRIASRSQNISNKPKKNGCSSSFKGVTWDKAKKKWQASLKHLGKFYYLGRYDNERDAAIAYDKKALSIFGEFSSLNYAQGSV